MRILLTALTFISMSLILTSCSGTTSTVTPLPDDSSLITSNSISEITNSGIAENPYRGVFGAWKVNVDLKNLTAEMVPARNAQAIGAIFDADLSQFLTVKPCSNCLRIVSMGLDPRGFINMSVGMQHPFRNLSTRPDLHGFDVRLIFMLESNVVDFPSIKVMQTDGVEVDASVSYYALMNADGFTSHYRELVSDPRYFIGGTAVPANINPFVRFFNDPSTGPFDPHAPAGHNIMPVNSNPEVKNLKLVGPEGANNFTFYLVADVAYGQSAVFSNRQNPQYYLPAFNRTEPWRLEYWLENNNLSRTNPASTCDVVVQVFDWQQGSTVDPNYPDPANLSGIPQSSNILRLELSVPGFMDTPVVVTAPESGAGTPDNPLQYRLQVQNQKGEGSSQLGLLAVRDELYGQAAPGGRIPIPPSPAGFPYETQDIRDYTLYHLLRIIVPESPGTYPYNRELEVDVEDQYVDGTRTSMNAVFFMDPSGSLFQFDWDFDYDGVTFDVDGSGMPSPSFEPVKTGINSIGLRVTTNSVPPQIYTYTIPLYKVGDALNKILDTQGLLWDSTSVSRGNSVDMSSNYYYVAYVSESAGKRDCWLAVGDKAGNFNYINLTEGLPEAFYNPAIEVIEDGVHDGVYITLDRFDAFDYDLYSTYGNLDGTGFDVSHFQPIAATPINFEGRSSLTYKFDKLLCYYWMLTPPSNGDIMMAYSTDYGLTWNGNGQVDDDPAFKFNPCVTYCSSDSRVAVVWEDYRNSGSSESDLYMARSYGGLDFDPSVNLSSLPGVYTEHDPQVSSKGQTIAIAYLSEAPASTESHLRVKLYDIYTQANLDFKPYAFNQDGYEASRPSISYAADDKIYVTFATFDPFNTELSAHLVEYKFDRTILYFNENTIYNNLIGNVEPGFLKDYYNGPVITSRNHLDDHVAEYFVVWNTYQNGRTVSPNPFTYYFGDLDAMLYFSKASEF